MTLVPTTPQPADEKAWDEFYNDPTDDVILKSSDGVHFRASSHRLAVASTLFKDMFATIGKNKKHSNEVVDMPFQAPTIRSFLGMISSSTPNPDSTIKFDIAAELLQLVKQYDCGTFVTSAYTNHQVCMSEDPLAAFVWASHCGDVELARAALSYIITAPKWNGITINNSLVGMFAFLDAVSTKWREYTLRFVLEETSGQVATKRFRSTPAHIRIRAGWSHVANRFDPEGTLISPQPDFEQVDDFN